MLPAERIVGVETGACPHTAIRDDVTANLIAVETLEADVPATSRPPLDVVLVESGGDNLTATFSPALVDAQLFVLDVAGGGDVARKGGPGIARADLLVVNKTDLAPYVGVDVTRMVADAPAARAGAGAGALAHRPGLGRRAGRLGARHVAAHLAGTHIPVDPGPMAPHSHAHDHEPGHAHTHALRSPRRTAPPPGGRPGPTPLRSRSPGDVRLALVATQALLLAGDHVRIEVVVHGPVQLDLVETAGTVAYDMRGGSASWEVDVVLRNGARLTWDGEPFVVAAGA